MVGSRSSRKSSARTLGRTLLPRVLGFSLRLSVVDRLALGSCDHGPTSASFLQHRPFAFAAIQLLFSSDACLSLCVVLVGYLDQFLAFVLGTAGQGYVPFVVIGLFGFGVIEICGFAVAVQLRDITHVVQRECVFRGDLVSLFKILPRLGAIIPIES